MVVIENWYHEGERSPAAEVTELPTGAPRPPAAGYAAVGRKK
ncbi:hypothetical protein ACPESR_07580 [Nocardia testacea]